MSNKNIVMPEESSNLDTSKAEDKASLDSSEDEVPKEEQLMYKAPESKRTKKSVSSKIVELKGEPTIVSSPKLGGNVQSNLEDLTEWFKCLEMLAGCTILSKVKTEAPICFMCGKVRHLVQECSKSKFFLNQGICHFDAESG